MGRRSRFSAEVRERARKLPLQVYRVKLDSPEGAEGNAEIEIHRIADFGGAEGR
jgi:hypothetical protein